MQEIAMTLRLKGKEALKFDEFIKKVNIAFALKGKDYKKSTILRTLVLNAIDNVGDTFLGVELK